MKQSIYLHASIVDILRCYGKLDDVINKILEEGASGKFDIMDKPPCPNREGAGRYDVDIVEPTYLSLLEIYSPFSPKISIRRLIYWFVDNEMYNVLNWTQNKMYKDRKEILFANKITNSLSELTKAKRYCTHNDIMNKLNCICDELTEIKEYLDNGGKYT